MKPRRAVLAPLLLAPLLLAACGSSSGSGTTAATVTNASAGAGASAATVRVVSDPSGGTMLATPAGLTLYYLSGETAGHLICTSSGCLSAWHPLTVTAGATPAGAASLGTIARTGGTTQVTLAGKPLYTFSGDSSAGQTNGAGVKDVGTWTPASTSAPASEAGAPSAPAKTSTSEGSYHY